MSRPLVGAQVTAALAILLVAGCGGGSGRSATGTRASAGWSSGGREGPDFICRTRNDAQVAATHLLNGTASGAARFTTELGLAYEKEIAALKALSPPAEAKSDFDAFIADQESILRDVKNATKAVQNNDINAYRAQEAQAFATEIASLPKASAAGLTICAEKLPAADQKAITKLAIQGTVNPSPELCIHSITHHLLETNFGGDVHRCRQQITQSRASSAKVTQLYGILPSATVFLTQVGASPPRLLMTFIKQQGAWRIDSVASQP